MRNWIILILLQLGTSIVAGQTKKVNIVVDGSVLDYAVEGKGIPCLVLGSSVYYPKTFSEELRTYLEFYFVDLKWFAKGYRQEDLDTVNISSIVADVEQIRQLLGLERPLILGHSIHGTIALEYAKAHPDKILGVVAIGSPCEWGNETYEKKAADLWKTASSERKKLQNENWGKFREIDRLTGQEEAVANYNRMSPQYWYDATYDASWLWDGMTVHSEVTVHLFTRVFHNYNLFSSDFSLKVPVFIALGKYDYVIPYTLWQPAYSKMPDFTRVLFDRSGHTPQLEEQERFDEIFLGWLEARFNASKD